MKYVGYVLAALSGFWYGTLVLFIFHLGKGLLYVTREHLVTNPTSIVLLELLFCYLGYLTVSAAVVLFSIFITAVVKESTTRWETVSVATAVGLILSVVVIYFERIVS